MNSTRPNDEMSTVRRVPKLRRLLVLRLLVDILLRRVDAAALAVTSSWRSVTTPGERPSVKIRVDFW